MVNCSQTIYIEKEFECGDYDDIIAFLMKNARKRCRGCFLYHIPLGRWCKKYTAIKEHNLAREKPVKETYGLSPIITKEIISECLPPIPTERMENTHELKPLDIVPAKSYENSERQPSHPSIISLIESPNHRNVHNKKSESFRGEEVQSLDSSWNIFNEHLATLLMEKEPISMEKAITEAEKINFFPELGFYY